MANPTTFFQVAAALLGTLLISGVLAETRAVASSESTGAKLSAMVALALVLGGFVVGELLCLDVLVGQPPTQDKHLVVEGALAACALATVVLAMLALGTGLGTRFGVGGAFIVLAVCGGGYLLARSVESSIYSGLGREGLLAQCPGAAGGSKFIGTVTSEPDTAVRATPGLATSNRVLHRYPTDCLLGFTGYCLGRPVSDAKNGFPDARWLVIQGREKAVVASANIRDVPTATSSGLASQGPIDCAGGEKRLPAIRLTGSLRGPVVMASSDQPDKVAFAGFAVRFRDPGAKAARWHRLAPDTSPSDGIATQLKAANYRRPAQLLVTECLAAEAPSTDARATAVAQLPTGRVGRSMPLSVVNEGTAAACALQA